MKDLAQLNYASTFVDQLPGDAETENYVRQVPHSTYSRVKPTAVSNPRLLAWSSALGDQLKIARATNGEALGILSGNHVTQTMKPYSARYGGHQFGHWAGQLGDGRAITLGEVQGDDGLWDLQLKGAGPTPYSRRADGRAVLRSSVREFLCSEAMHALGVPTTRALSLVGSADRIVRDMFYDGNPEYEPLAIVARMAPSFVRFGNFQILAAAGEKDELSRLVDYVLTRHFPEIDKKDPDRAFLLYQTVCKTTAVMIAHWQRVGFVHGVMNTDNMSILGLTIDYGPYGWLEAYEPDWTPNTTDASQRRYRFANQPAVAHWNLAQLGSALSQLSERTEFVEEGLADFRKVFSDTYMSMLGQKLGLQGLTGDEDVRMAQELDRVLQLQETDMTIFYRNLSQVPLSSLPENDLTLIEPLLPAFYQVPADGTVKGMADWIRAYAQRARTEGLDEETRVNRMLRTNPKYVLRNYMAQEAIDLAHTGDVSRIEELLHVLARPYDEQVEMERYFARRPEWARSKAGCSALSCSS